MLTQATTAVYIDRTFNLIDFLQSQDRILRKTWNFLNHHAGWFVQEESCRAGSHSPA